MRLRASNVAEVLVADKNVIMCRRPSCANGIATYTEPWVHRHRGCLGDDDNFVQPHACVICAVPSGPEMSCRGSYSACANAVCSGNVQGADSNGCTTDDQATSAATCTTSFGALECGTYTCSLDATAANGGCSVSPDDGACAAGDTCVASTCSATGACMEDEAASNANCVYVSRIPQKVLHLMAFTSLPRADLLIL